MPVHVMKCWPRIATENLTLRNTEHQTHRATKALATKISGHQELSIFHRLPGRPCLGEGGGGGAGALRRVHSRG